jgi:predicted acylesterase/phospholipase RssA
MREGKEGEKDGLGSPRTESVPGSECTFPYDSLILQGGGVRSLFGLGFLAGTAPRLGGLRQIAAVSAGVAAACAHLGGAHEEALELMIASARRHALPARSVLARLLAGQRPTAHYEAYRSFIEALIDPLRFRRIREHGTRLRLVITACRGLARFRPVAAVLALITARRSVTPRAFLPVIIEAQACRDREELIAAILASSAFPLLTPLPLRGGRAVVDGGMIEPVAFGALERPCRPLAILSQPRPLRPLPEALPFLGPAAEPLSSWSLTDEQGMRALFSEGREAGARLLGMGACGDNGLHEGTSSLRA